MDFFNVKNDFYSLLFLVYNQNYSTHLCTFYETYSYFQPCDIYTRQCRQFCHKFENMKGKSLFQFFFLFKMTENLGQSEFHLNGEEIAVQF